MKDFLYIGLIVVLIVAGPLLAIWALNALFPALAIPYTIKTWFAAAVLMAALKGSGSYKDSK